MSDDFDGDFDDPGDVDGSQEEESDSRPDHDDDWFGQDRTDDDGVDFAPWQVDHEDSTGHLYTKEGGYIGRSVGDSVVDDEGELSHRLGEFKFDRDGEEDESSNEDQAPVTDEDAAEEDEDSTDDQATYYPSDFVISGAPTARPRPARPPTTVVPQVRRRRTSHILIILFLIAIVLLIARTLLGVYFVHSSSPSVSAQVTGYDNQDPYHNLELHLENTSPFAVDVEVHADIRTGRGICDRSDVGALIASVQPFSDTDIVVNLQCTSASISTDTSLDVSSCQYRYGFQYLPWNYIYSTWHPCSTH